MTERGRSGWSIRTRLIVLVIVICVLFLALYVYTSQRAQERASVDIQADALRVAQLQAADIDHFIADQRHLLEGLVRRPLMRIENPPTCDHIFADFTDLFPAFANLGMSNRAGRIVCSAVSVPGAAPASVANQEFFKTMMATGLFTIGAPFIGPITGKWVLTLIQPRRDNQGQLIGGLGLPIDLARFERILATAHMPQQGVVSLIDSRGVVLMRSRDPSQWLGKDLAAHALIRTLLTTDQGAVRAYDIDGRERYIGYARVPGSGWRVYFGVSTDLVEKRARTLLRSDLKLGGVILLLVLALGSYVSHSIAQPVRALARTVRGIAAGDQQQRAIVSGPQEIAAVAADFNVMIAQRRAAEQALQEAHADLEQRVVERTRMLNMANQELEAFSYSVSHDLRAPLRSIEGFSQALLEDYHDRLDAVGQDYLRRVSRSCQRMNALIDDLLTLSRAASAEPHRRDCDLGALGAELIAELRGTEPGRSLTFTVAPDLRVHGDPELLRIALGNLLSNAWKFTRPTAAACIELGMTREQGREVYFVRDNGVGFDMQYAERLFVPFQRLHHVDDFEGTGIGLAIVQRIIRRHGGTVWAQAQIDAGATFYFTLDT